MNYPAPVSLRTDQPSTLLELGAPGDAAPASRIDLMQIYAIIRRNRFFLLGAMLAALTIGIVVTALTTPKYVASSSIQIDQESNRILSSQEVQPSEGVQDADRFLQTQVDVLKSQAMAERVARSLRLLNNPDFFTRMRVKPPKMEAGSEQRQIDSAVGLLQQNLTVVLPRNSRLVTISFLSADPRLAADVANAYAKGYIDYNIQRKYDSSSYARAFLSRQLAQAKDKLEQSERQLNGYARSAQLIKTGDGSASASGANKSARSGSVTTQSLVQLNEALNNAKASRIGAERKWQSAASTSVMSLPEVLTNPSINVLVQQRAQKEAELNDALALHKDSYPLVRTLHAQVDELNKQIASIAGSVKTSLHDAYLVAQQQENSLASQVSGLKGATLAEQDRDVQYNILGRESDTNRTMYDGLLQRFKEVSAAAGITQNNVSIIDSASPPIFPSSPKLFVNVAIALIVGAALGLLLVLMREHIDDAVRSPTDVEAKLGLQLLGVIPKVARGSDVMELLGQPRTNISEAYNALRTSLLYASPDGRPQTVLVTSAQASEGKSTTSYALAESLARLGIRVVLVDTDLRRPSLHRVIGTSNARGLSSVLAKQATLTEVIQLPENLYQRLSFVPAGPIPPSPTELLGSVNMRETIAELSRVFDMVVLDGPPVLGLADSPILASLADATVFVVEAERNRRGGTKAALRRLLSARARIVGVVLTKFDAKKSGSADYYGYENYYYYGKDASIEDDRDKHSKPVSLT